MQFRLLGEIAVEHEGRLVDLHGHRNAGLLALLAVHLNRAVPAAEIIDQLWGEAASASARQTLQAQIHRLRRHLPTAQIETTSSGYRLLAASEQVDTWRFEQAVAAAQDASAAGDRHLAYSRCNEALGLWRGPALADVLDYPFAMGEHARLESLRLDAEELGLDAMIEVAAPEAVALAEVLSQQAPLREQRWAQWMRALYVCGRQADALETFARARTVLIDQLGVEPGPQLQSMQTRVLTHDSSLAPAAGAPPAVPLATWYSITRGGHHLAYDQGGTGPPVILVLGGWSGTTLRRHPLSARFVRDLRTFSRTACYDTLGVGLSDALPPSHGVSGHSEDLLGLLETLGDRQAILYGANDGAAIAINLAAHHPGRVLGLILHNGYARLRRDADYQHGLTEQQVGQVISSYRTGYGTGITLDLFAPSLRSDPSARAWWADAERSAARRSEAPLVTAASLDIDVRRDLPLLAERDLPTLIVHSDHNRAVPVEHGRYLARQLPAATYREVAGIDHAIWVNGHDALTSIRGFVADFNLSTAAS